MSAGPIGSIKLDRDRVHIVFLGLPNVPGVAAEIFRSLAERGISVGMITQNTMRGGRADLSFLIHREHLEEVIPICRGISNSVGAQGVSFATEVAALTIEYASGTSNTDGSVFAKIFSALAEAGVNMEIINSGPTAVVCIVSLVHAERGVRTLQERFFPSQEGTSL